MGDRVFLASVVQTLAVLGDVDANIDLLQRYTKEAVLQGARLVVFPECMNSGYLFDSASHAAKIAEPLNGPYVLAMAELARRHGLHIASGFTERAVDGKLYNTGLLLNPAGELVCHYQKQFLATHDQNWFEFGTKGCPVVDTELGRIGMLICFDGRIPEIARALSLQGAEVLVDMANFFAMDQAEMWGPARAFENGVWLVAATKAGVERSIYYPGGSMIVAPSGEIRVQLPYDTHGVATAAIDPDAARDKRWPLGGDKFLGRRPNAYTILARRFDDTPIAALVRKPLVAEDSYAKVAAVQAHATEAPGSLERALDMVEHAALLGVKVISLPQHFAVAHWQPSVNAANAVAAVSEMCLARFGKIAKTFGAVIVFPTFEKTPAGISPVAVVVGPDGDEIGRYTQVHLEPELEGWAISGDAFQVFDTPHGRIAPLLGYDGLYPESARAVTLLGADIITCASAWRHRFERELLAVPKAEDNRVYAVFANRTDCPYPGGSFVVPPNGFPMWDVNVASPRIVRHGAVMPAFAHLALARQKKMIPKVDMLRNRLIQPDPSLVCA